MWYTNFLAKMTAKRPASKSTNKWSYTIYDVSAITVSKTT